MLPVHVTSSEGVKKVPTQPIVLWGKDNHQFYFFMLPYCHESMHSPIAKLVMWSFGVAVWSTVILQLLFIWFLI